MDIYPNFCDPLSHILRGEQQRVNWPGSDLVFKVDRDEDPQNGKRRKSKGRKI